MVINKLKQTNTKSEQKHVQVGLRAENKFEQSNIKIQDEKIEELIGGKVELVPYLTPDKFRKRVSENLKYFHRDLKQFNKNVKEIRRQFDKAARKPFYDALNQIDEYSQIVYKHFEEIKNQLQTHTKKQDREVHYYLTYSKFKKQLDEDLKHFAVDLKDFNENVKQIRRQFDKAAKPYGDLNQIEEYSQIIYKHFEEIKRQIDIFIIVEEEREKDERKNVI